jgi:molybdopterin-containing oxidoreductase family iron-sulfur binding subunit
VVNAINNAIGAIGTTVNWGVTSQYRQGIDADFDALVADMNAGKVGALFVLGANPVYTAAQAEQFKAGLKKVALSVSFNSKFDETTELCKFSVPSHHFLESWGDAEPKSGYVSFIQPTIAPLFKTRQWQDSLMAWSSKRTSAIAVADTAKPAAAVAAAAGDDYVSYLKRFWATRLGSQEAWDKVLRDGVISPVTMPVGGAALNDAATATALAALANAPKAGAWEVVLYEKTGIGSGAQANNPWLQEMPDPVTKATWDNYAIISAAAAKELLGIDITDNGDADSYEVNPKKPVVKIKANGKEIELAAIIVPGTQKNTIGIALGYGQSEKVGIAVRGAGKNAYPLTSVVNGAVSYAAYDATITATGDVYEIAQNQTHNSYEGRMEVVKETSLATFKKHPEMFKAQRDALVHDYAKRNGDYRNEGSLYDPRLNDRPGIHWGMSVDLNTCNGCGACVVACNAENNIPVVGKTEVLRGHDMHWMRIDRYYVTDTANPDEVKDVVFMPMMCQHCDNAPCENVCPVAATNHSSEGLNQMTYNRCIGTRYCANNCPYKVRRFNWADYTGADSFPDNQVGHISDVTLEMNDDLYRMVLNPDVTVRSRGVIEKCSFCVQRLQAGKLEAKKMNRPLVDGEVKSACQSACPTNAITFGDSNDKNSLVRKERDHSPLRMYYALEQIHVLPNVNYLAKIRNTDEVMEVEAAHKPAAEAGAAHH